MARQGFRCTAVPGHRADIGSFGHVEAVRNVQIYRRIVGAADGNGFNALNFHLVGNVTHPCIVAVYAAVAALVAHRNGAADNEARSLGSSQQHTLHAGFGGCNLILQAVAGAAFQNAAIFKVEMAQLPHIQHIQAVTVAPHRIVSSLLAGQGQTALLKFATGRPAPLVSAPFAFKPPGKVACQVIARRLPFGATFSA